MRLYRSLTALAVAAAVSAPNVASAQGAATNYPSRPVTVVVPFAAGGTTDSELRLYTGKLQASTGQPFVFDFRGGAGTTIGVGYALRANPDGYTILSTNSGITVFPNFYPELNHSMVNQLIPVTELSTRSAGVLVSVAGLPDVRSLPDLIAYGKANPGKLNCNTAGAGAATHIACVALSNVIGIPIAPVHYKGVGPGQIDLIAGRTQVSVGTVFNAMNQVKAGKLRFIAIMGAHRSKLMPELATTHELGFDVDYPSWLGVFAPPKTPQPIVNKLNAEFVKAVKSPDVVAALEKVGSTAVGSSEAEFRKKFASEMINSKKIIDANKITAKGD
jgi:tripartite-type tricarboxylate transporter receptor subunit TctC